MRHTHLIAAVTLVAAAFLSGCAADEPLARTQDSGAATSHSAQAFVPTGTSLDVTLSTPLSSETANVGSPWSGSIRTASMIDGRDIVPAGSEVSGTVTGVTPARKGDRAMLDLGLSSVTVDGHRYAVRGGMESVVAGSTRARNLGAIGAATVAGALVGNAVGGSTKGTVIGAVVGGTAATGAVSQTRGWQVVLKEGTPLTFTTSKSFAVRL